MTVSANPEWDVIVIGSGIGGLVTASQLAAKGAKTLVLERYLIPGGSGGSFKRDGFTGSESCQSDLPPTTPAATGMIGRHQAYDSLLLINVQNAP